MIDDDEEYVDEDYDDEDMSDHAPMDEDENFTNFLIRAKKSTYADSKSKYKVESTRVGSKDYEYTEEINGNKYTYHDTYFGSIKFSGQEVVYLNDKPIWSMSYQTTMANEDIIEKVYENVLRPALSHVGEDKSILPIRGPKELHINGFVYNFFSDSSLNDFHCTEIVKQYGFAVYRLECFGGMIK